MEALIVFFTVVVAAVGGLFALDVAALRWGVDSRGPLPDDHHR
jgi:hypothetical protein